MMSDDIHATEEQYRRIRDFLGLARQFSLLRQFMDEWHAAETDDDRLTITRWWAAVIAPAGQGWAWYPAFDLACTVEYQEKDNRETTARDEGTEVEYDAVISVAALEWPRRAPVAQARPKEGDVIEVFGHYWDVVKANSGGNIMDTPTTVGWQLNVKIRESFVAERKIP